MAKYRKRECCRKHGYASRLPHRLWRVGRQHRLQHRGDTIPQRDNFVAWHRRTEQIALHFGATGPKQRGQLLRRLDTFSSGCHAKFLAEPRDGSHNSPAIALGAQVANERLIDLDAVEWKAPQVTQ